MKDQNKLNNTEYKINMSQIKKDYYKENPMSEEHKRKISDSKRESYEKQKQVTNMLIKISEIINNK